MRGRRMAWLTPLVLLARVFSSPIRQHCRRHAANASLTFIITFTPAQPGILKGALFINADTLNLAGQGLGAQLVFSYAAGSNTVTLGGS